MSASTRAEQEVARCFTSWLVMSLSGIRCAPLFGIHQIKGLERGHNDY
jgi:hypothetical protein